MKLSLESALPRIRREGSSDAVGGGSQYTCAQESPSHGDAGLRTLVEAFPSPVIILRALDGGVLDTNCHIESHRDRYGFHFADPDATPEVIGGDVAASLARALRDRRNHAEIGTGDKHFFARISSHPTNFAGEEASLVVIDEMSDFLLLQKPFDLAAHEHAFSSALQEKVV